VYQSTLSSTNAFEGNPWGTKRKAFGGTVNDLMRKTRIENQKKHNLNSLPTTSSALNKTTADFEKPVVVDYEYMKNKKSK